MNGRGDNLAQIVRRNIGRHADSDAESAVQEQIRERIVATNDMRLFSLLHLLGQASLRMEQALWPEDYERMTREVEEALRQATDANARSYTHEEVMQAMQERIDRARDKPC